MTLQQTSLEVPPPFGPAIVGRGLAIQKVIEERDPVTGAYAAKDLTGFTVHLRLWAADADDAVISTEVVTKGAATGELDHYHPCGTVVRDAVRWELVIADDANGDADTISTQREIPLIHWRQPILDAPRTTT